MAADVDAGRRGGARSAGADGRFCSLVSRAVGEDPIGSASPFDSYLLIEMKPPWHGLWYEARSAGQDLLDAMARAREAGLRFRPLAIAPDEAYSDDGRVRVVVATRPGDLAHRFVKRDYSLAPDEVTPLVDAVLNDPASTARFEARARDTSDVRDLLVCTHGNVDVCCGRFGFPLYRTLRRDAASERLRVWRVSHFGGHNFAPTLVDLPDGRWWGHLDERHLPDLAARTGAFEPLADAYRGSSLLPPLAQMVEKEILLREGWAWTSTRVRGRVLDAEGHGSDEDLASPKFADAPPERARVEIAFARPDGRNGTYRATVVRDGHVMTQWESQDPARTPSYRFQVEDLSEHGA